MNKKNKIFSYIRLVIYAAAIIAVVLLLNGILITNCYWHDKYNVLCPTCGMTRATIKIFKLNIKDAVRYHVIYTCVLFPIIAILVFNDVYTMICRLVKKNDKLSIVEKICGLNGYKNKKYIVSIFIVFAIFVTYGIVRNFI